VGGRAGRAGGGGRGRTGARPELLLEGCRGC
jgi:hypothetical protein